MRRREFIALLGGAAFSGPVAARAQQTAMPVIGWLSNGSPEGFKPFLAAFHRGLAETGFVEGQNISIEYRWAERRTERLSEMATDLVQRRVSLIAVGGGNQAALAAKSATATIPIVFQVGGDPIALGLVASLNRPGGNATGVTSLNAELERKRLEVLRELLPSAKVLAVLVNPKNTTTNKPEANASGVELRIVRASQKPDFAAVFSTLKNIQPDGLLISSDPLFLDQSEQLAALANSQALPTISPYREFANAGGLLSYGVSLVEQFRIVGVYSGRILKGEKPADLPVQQATKVELLVNLKTAKTLGITVPIPILGRADEVIE